LGSGNNRETIIHGGRQAQKQFHNAMTAEFQRQVEEEARKVLAWKRAQPKGERRKFKFGDTGRNNEAHKDVHKTRE